MDNADSLIDELFQAVKDSVLHPNSGYLLRRMANRRIALERYIFRLERKLDIRSEDGRYDT